MERQYPQQQINTDDGDDVNGDEDEEEKEEEEEEGILPKNLTTPT